MGATHYMSSDQPPSTQSTPSFLVFETNPRRAWRARRLILRDSVRGSGEVFGDLIYQGELGHFGAGAEADHRHHRACAAIDVEIARARAVEARDERRDQPRKRKASMQPEQRHLASVRVPGELQLHAQLLRARPGIG